MLIQPTNVQTKPKAYRHIELAALNALCMHILYEHKELPIFCKSTSYMRKYHDLTRQDKQLQPDAELQNTNRCTMRHQPFNKAIVYSRLVSYAETVKRNARRRRNFRENKLKYDPCDFLKMGQI